MKNELLEKPVSYSQTTITELMVPSYANFSGKVHGGILLSMMDKVAYVCASKHSGCYCVTVSVDGVEFKKPVGVGELVSLAASVNYVGKSSMIVGIRVESLHPRTGEVKHTNSCYFTMVAKGEDDVPTEVPKLILESDEQVRRFLEAKELRKMRRKMSSVMSSGMKALKVDDMIPLLNDDRCVIILT